MKLTLNCAWGGWMLPDDLEEQFYYMDIYDDPKLRYNKDIIDYLETHLDTYDGDLKVFELPEETTDHRIINYDGQEDCLYVIDGKLHWLRGYFKE